MDDRMAQEDQKSLAMALMSQSSTTPAGKPHLSESHPDTGWAATMFGEEQSPTPSQGFDLSPLTEAEPPRRLNEDLVQQAAQSLVKNQVDAFLAITRRMSGEEIAKSLQTARSWRRPDDDWQEKFVTAPQTGFSFIDQKSPNKPKKKSTSKPENKARKLVTDCVQFMALNDLKDSQARRLVSAMAERQKIKLGEASLDQLTSVVISRRKTA